MIALLLRHKRYTALLNIPGQLPTQTPCFEAVDLVQAARYAIHDWAALCEIAEVQPIASPRGLVS